MAPSRLIPLLAAAAVVLLRLPFLMLGEGFFNSDEAVEGLMARHLDDLPVFFWGQGYKGIPEVYLDGAVFALFGAGVLQLKSVTLALSALSVFLLVRLAQTWHGERAAVVAAILLVACSPALVYWQLSANAEVAILSGLFAAMLLDLERGRASRDGTVPSRVFLWCGLALWIHPVAICGVIGLMLTVLLRSQFWKTEGWSGLLDVALARNQPRGWRVVVLTIHLAIATLAILFVFSFLGGRLELGFIRTTHPQRSLRPLGLLCSLAILLAVLRRPAVSTRRILTSCAWFAAGLAPVLFQALRGGGIGTNVITRRITDMPEILAGLYGDVTPIMLGMSDAESHSLGLPVFWTGPVILAIVVHFVRRREEWNAAKYLFIPIAAGAVFLLMTVGGGYQGSSSIRYFMPFWGLILVGAADGVSGLWPRSRLAAVILILLATAVSAVGQYRWYERLRPDPSWPTLIACLEREGHRAGRADYWVAYRLTFLARERVIIAPHRNQDRYPPYQRLVDAADRRVRVDLEDDGSSRPALCRAGSLRAFVD